MKLTEQVVDTLLGADAKALATGSNGDINVVPVSAIRVVGDKVWLANFFMNKTAKNVVLNPKASLVCWKGGEGYQLKVDVAYMEDGPEFEEAKLWIAKIAPQKSIKGLLILNPWAIFDVSPIKDRAGMQIA